MRKQILIAAAYLSYFPHMTKARLLLYDLPHATHEDEELPL